MKKSPLKRKSKNQSEITRKKCVEIAKKINKINSDYKCQYCGVGKPQRQVHSHHIFNEGIHRAMSADIDNLICLCAVHHTGGKWGKSNDGFAFHLAPAEAMEWFKSNFPSIYKDLLERTRKSIQADEFYWKNKLIVLQEVYKELE